MKSATSEPYRNAQATGPPSAVSTPASKPSRGPARRSPMRRARNTDASRSAEPSTTAKATSASPWKPSLWAAARITVCRTLVAPVEAGSPAE